jgi:molybdopterin/thiamine biosynthesis adenylyltransferase
LRQQLEAIRTQAKRRAAEYLATIGFNKDAGSWRGDLNLGDHGNVAVRLTLPESFPDCLPSIHVDRTRLPRRVPHVEKSGKLCLAPTTGFLVDAEDPEGILRDALEIARRTLQRGLAGAEDEDFKREFLAYWGGKAELLADCHASGRAREISLFTTERKIHSGTSNETVGVLADTDGSAEKLTGLVGGVVSHRGTGFFLPLADPFAPPDFDEVLSTRDILHRVRALCSHESWSEFTLWLGHPVLPAVVLLSMPNGESHAVFAVRFDEVPSSARKQAMRGFRPGRVPAYRELQFAQAQPVTRIRVVRYDAAFLLPRGGALETLQSKTVAVVGCGSVGSYAIERIASAGVGHLRLVDAEALESCNLYRHALGIGYVDVNKAEGMSQAIQTRYPHVETQFRPEAIEAVLQNDPDFVLTADVILVALGEETLELRLNELLGPQKPRVHAWLDPLGIGGHVLATAITPGPGCLRCLFERQEAHGLVNKASFAQPGQSFQRSFAGCSGTFTPFSGIDADRTAVEAARLIARILRGQEAENLLVSWFGFAEDFEGAGFTLSARARRFQPGDCKRRTDFATPGCPHCGNWQA